MDIKIQKIVNLHRCYSYFSFDSIVQVVQANPPRLLQTRLILIYIHLQILIQNIELKLMLNKKF